MNPILKAGDGLRVIPYDGKKIQPGDVVVFRHPESGSNIAHRVVGVQEQRIMTRGDNNNEMDPWVLRPEDIIGRVVFGKRKNRRTTVWNGKEGLLLARILWIKKWVDSRIAGIFRPVYRRLAKSGLFHGWLSPFMTTRIFYFNRPDGTELQLVIGRWVIGKRPPKAERWRIRPPFRIFVDEAALPGRNPEDTSKPS